LQCLTSYYTSHSLKKEGEKEKEKDRKKINFIDYFSSLWIVSITIYNVSVVMQTTTIWDGFILTFFPLIKKKRIKGKKNDAKR